MYDTKNYLSLTNYIIEAIYSNVNDCINSGNNLKQFDGLGDPEQGVWSLNVIKDKTNTHVVFTNIAMKLNVIKDKTNIHIV